MVKKVDAIGPWSKEKLTLLKEYLAAYTSILNRKRSSPPKPDEWPRAIIYIDAFAGSVTPWDKEAQEYIAGSPVVAISTVPNFDEFVFIDKDCKRLKENIAPLQGEYNDKDIKIYHGDCNEVLCRDVLPHYSPKCGKRAFIFLDPYGLELRWSTVEAIGETKVFDVFINFSVMGVYRQLGDSPPDEVNRRCIDDMMGCNDWFEAVYQESQQFTLPGLGAKLERQGHQLAERLAEFYRKRLATCFECVSRAVIMRNSKGGPLYALILASQKRLAVDKMHEIFDRRERKVRKACRP
jgi:three-Cys-motif partner protein